jgi:hypothetical protein
MYKVAEFAECGSFAGTARTMTKVETSHYNYNLDQSPNREVRCGTEHMCFHSVRLFRDPSFGYPEHSNWQRVFGSVLISPALLTPQTNKQTNKQTTQSQSRFDSDWTQHPLFTTVL